ncbi:hypothetical protein EST38_g482 [Candolleomyces aberdarensis]|uniref:BBC1/AIM3 cysteine proteinase-fold domain-containing protein n=1 Tax=Candolleomyces aberdarensis TaxID=2316362 RepID=A0A4Q2DYK5_9AGAR|nr:hypothetical protein EST38_g482 [Candolleomyces aberdarensis]
MSDPQETPPKKISSLRDRIAAFEKAGAGSAAPAPAPAPRPKPAGFSTWKPRPPSPTSPAANEASQSSASKPSTGLSTADAKDSIVKGGSLKERMAALQGKGGFGGAPPVAPKPPIEKPKWKPPPVVASPPPDDDDDQPREAPNLANIIKSPPLPPSSEIVEKASGEGGEKEEQPSAEGDETAEPDPEEEERQRRAAIAARMARLGGTRVGMTPAVFGKRPPPPPKKRSSTSEDVLASESSKESPTSPRLQPTAEESKPHEAVLDRAIVSPPNEAAAEPGSPPQPSDSQSAKSPPSSMPVPAVPRRAAPPRRKPQKPTAPPPPVPEAEGEKEPSATSHESLPSHDIAATELAEKIEQVQVTEVTTPGSPPAISGKDETTAEAPSAVSEAPAIREVPKEPLSESDVKDPIALGKAEPAVEQQHDEDEPEAPGEAEPEPEPELDEEARRRQVAERIAKMGGINPFAAQLPPRRQSSRIEEPAEQSEEPAPPKEEQPVVASSPEQSSSLSPIEPVSPPLALAEEEQADETDVAVPVPPRVQDSSRARAPSSTVHEPTNLREPPQKEADDNDSDESEYEDEDESAPKPVSAGLSSRREERLEEVDNKRVLVSESSPSIPVPPPRAHPHRAVPPPPEADTVDESDSENEYEDMTRSQILSRSEEKEKGISKGNDSDDGTPLPIPPRASRSIDARETAATLTRGRAVSDASLSGLDDDEQEPLPVRPPATFAHDAPSPERDSIPLFVPPPPPIARPPPPPATRGLPPAPSTLHESSSQSSLKVPTQAEVLDDDEGDPIDPSFHSPSRRASAILPASTTIGPLDDATSDNEAPTVEEAPQPAVVPEEKEDPEAARRRTIADRMAKLGGIKFGAAPPVPGQLNKRPPPVQQQVEESAPSTEEANDPQSQEDLTEEEEERARKERIAAKLAGMGGMRIGMMPTAFPPRKSHALSDKASSAPAPAPPAPSRPPPPQAPGNESEYEGSTTSEDAVKVEAEESEIEEVSLEDVQEEVPPPIPSRAARASRRESSELPSSPPPIPQSPPMASSPPTRPPVPVGLPARRPSTQTIGSQRRTSGDSGYTPSVTRRKSSVPKPHSEYVMVEEPQEEQAPPPLPPNRPAGRAPPPPTRSPPPAEPKESISSQWELPTIPTSTLAFEGEDLSMSWTEADAEPSSAPSMSSSQTYQHVASPPQPAAALSPRSANEVQLSSDELMAVWGRVGVQVCEVATTLFERSKKGLIGDGTYPGFVRAVIKEVPNAVLASDWGYLIYKQTGGSVQKRASEIMPGDLIELHDAKFKGHKGLQAYHQNVGAEEPVIGVISEFEPKKSKVKAFHANQHVGQQTVESISYRLEDLKSGTVKIHRVLEA